MTQNYIKAKIKDEDQFKQVSPILMDGNNRLARFVQSILGKTIPVRRVSCAPESFCYVSDINPSLVIIPSWIEYFDTEEMVPTNEDCIGLVLLADGNVIVLGR